MRDLPPPPAITLTLYNSINFHNVLVFTHRHASYFFFKRLPVFTSPIFSLQQFYGYWYCPAGARITLPLALSYNTKLTLLKKKGASLIRTFSNEKLNNKWYPRTPSQPTHTHTTQSNFHSFPSWCGHQHTLFLHVLTLDQLTVHMWCDQAKWVWSRKFLFFVFRHFLLG